MAPARWPTSSPRATASRWCTALAKLGLGTAVIEGFAAASAPVVGVIDADLSHPPDLLPGMLAVMQSTSADFVIGSRYIPGGGTRGWGLGRLLMSRFACLLARTGDAHTRRDLRLLPHAP